MALNAKQTAILNDVFAAMFLYIMLFGGSRSGKTYLIVYVIIKRALKAPGSRHVMLRFRFNHIKSSIVFDTFEKVMRDEYPKLVKDIDWKLSKTDWFVSFTNGSEIWFCGLDDKHRTEKILGKEYVTIYFNECSQISWETVGMVLTRLAQKVYQVIQGRDKIELQPRIYFDCNPPNKLHWTYLLFERKVDPDTKQPLRDQEKRISIRINPEDNKENISSSYLDMLRALPARLQKRFFKGEYSDATPNALFVEETFDKWRVMKGELPDMVRIVVAIDPSGSGDVDNADNDEIGIIVAGLGIDGVAYVLEDCSVKAGPAVWGKVATTAYDRWKANFIVGEINFGGAMVQHIINVARPQTPYFGVTASRGKHIRAEPVSALYEHPEGKVRHVGEFRQLEEELSGFTTSGYVGSKSPNRADALVWAITALFPGIVNATREETIKAPIPTHNFFQKKRI